MTEQQRGMISGAEAWKIMLGAMADGMETRRAILLDKEVRRRVALEFPGGRCSARDRMRIMARIIVEADDTIADRAFQLGLQRIRLASYRRMQ